LNAAPDLPLTQPFSAQSGLSSGVARAADTMLGL
jgi:hypothetical protein